MSLNAGGSVELTPVDYDPFAGPALARVVPTTEPQREVWLADRLGREASLAYNLSISLRFSGELKLDALHGALQDLVQRHESLRTTISANGEALYIAADLTLNVPLTDHSAIGAPGGPKQDMAIAAARQRAVETPFDLEHGPLFRAEIHKLGPDDHLLMVTAHHIVCDGWSYGVMMRDLASLYAGRAGAPATGVLGPAASFGDYALARNAAEGGTESVTDEAYWLSRFTGVIPTLDLPTDRARSAWRTFTSRREDYVLDAVLVSELRKTGSRHGASLFATLLGGFAAVLQRIAGTYDVVVGVPAAGQSVGGHDNLIGHCVNLLPLRLGIDAATPMTALIAATQTAVLDAYEHQAYTFGTLLKKLAMERDPSRLPLVSVMFNLDQALNADTLGFPGLKATFASTPRSYENFELFVNAVRLQGALHLECQYNADLFDGATVRRWLACYETLLRAACSAADTPLGQLAVVSDEDRRLLAVWNQTSRAFSRTALVHELTEAQASRAPARTAVTWQGSALSYGALDARANRIAHCLRSRGVRRGTLVGLHIDRQPDMIAAALAVLKAGAAYVPLDPSYPDERLAFMAQDAGLSVLITEAARASPLAWPRERSLYIDTDQAEISAQPATRLPRDHDAATPEDPALVIYTSGSTGKPKGVRVPHRAVVNFLESMAREPGLSAGDRLVAVTTLSFDIAVNEIFLPLSVGAQIVLAAHTDTMDGAVLSELLERSRATVMQATPGTWRLLIQAGWRGGGQFKALCGGEALSSDLAAQLLERTGSLWNMYGPTETTVWSTCLHLSGLAPGISIGRPIANTSVWILDEQLQMCPIGVPGEICIGGDGVTLGYLERPELTAERFIADPFSDSHGARLYRTGDRGRWLATGLVEHLGRLDFQVKVRGYRIELGEIEVRLAAHGDVAHALVIAREDRPGDVRLVAYLVAQPGTRCEDGTLRAHLKSALPDYMIPQHFVALPAMPLLPNGKVDRKSLPAPDMPAKTASTFVAPRSEVEKAVAAEMEASLGMPGVSLHDDFFALGGHSLLAAQLTSRLNRKFNTHLSIWTLFEAPTVARLAELLAHQKPQDSVVMIRPGGSKPPLFLVHDGLGETLLYGSLVHTLRDDRPVYGIEPHAAGGFAVLHTRITDMAAHYITRIRALQPQGPYYLGGLCAGGVIAFEMARQLQRQGQPVGMVALFEAADERAPLQAKPAVDKRLHRFVTAFKRNPSQPWVSFLASSVRVAAAKISGFFGFEVRRCIDLIRVWIVRQCLDRQIKPPAILRGLSAQKIIEYAQRGYTHGVPFQGTVTLFRATTGTGDAADEPFIDIFRDPLFGWEQHVQGSVLTIDIPGGHFSMLQEPHVAVLAARMQASLDAPFVMNTRSAA